MRRQSAAATPFPEDRRIHQATIISESGVALRFPPQSKMLQATGSVSLDGQLVRFSRPGLVEEYTVSMEGINQFGATDAWFPLATLTLTNTSQLYFDVSVIGQPPRLHRLVPVP